MVPRVILAIIAFLVSATSAWGAPVPDQVAFPGGAVLQFKNFEFPPLDPETKAKVRSFQSVAVAPSQVFEDSAAISAVVTSLNQRTGLKVFTPRDFLRAADELGETRLEKGLTEDEFNRIGQKVGKKLGANSVFLVYVEHKATRTGTKILFLLITIVQVPIVSHDFQISVRLVSVAEGGVIYRQALNYTITLEPRPPEFKPIFPPQPAELYPVLIPRMVERFLVDAWN